MSPSSSSPSLAWHNMLNTFCSAGSRAERCWQSQAMADSGQALRAGTT